jgi:hypothetical protein
MYCIVSILTATAWITKDLWFESQQGQEFFSSKKCTKLALGPTQPPIEWVLRALSLGVRQLGHEADHSPLSGV